MTIPFPVLAREAEANPSVLAREQGANPFRHCEGGEADRSNLVVPGWQRQEEYSGKSRTLSLFRHFPIKR
jgi:hypothetical protein